MTIKKYSKNSFRASSRKPHKPKRTALGRRLEAGLKEVLAHVRGEKLMHSYEVHVPISVDVAKIRDSIGMSQSKFAERFGLDVTAVQAWEQKRRQPDRAARVLLTIIKHEPEAVLRALNVNS